MSEQTKSIILFVSVCASLIPLSNWHKCHGAYYNHVTAATSGFSAATLKTVSFCHTVWHVGM